MRFIFQLGSVPLIPSLQSPAPPYSDSVVLVCLSGILVVLSCECLCLCGDGCAPECTETVQGWSHLATPSPGHHVTSCKPCCRRLQLKWKSLNPHGLARSVCKLRFPSPKHGNLGLQFPKNVGLLTPIERFIWGNRNGVSLQRRRSCMATMPSLLPDSATSLVRQQECLKCSATKARAPHLALSSPNHAKPNVVK